MDIMELTQDQRNALAIYEQHKHAFSIFNDEGDSYPGYLWAKNLNEFVGPITLQNNWSIDIQQFMVGEELSKGEIAAAEAIENGDAVSTNEAGTTKTKSKTKKK